MEADTHVMPDSLESDPETDSQAQTRSASVNDRTDAEAAPSEIPAKGAGDGVQEKRLADTEAALKERQAEYHRVSAELAEMRGYMSALREKATPEPPDPLDDETLEERFNADPGKTWREMQRAERAKFAEVLAARDQEYQKTLASLKQAVDVVADPERETLATAYSALDGKSWFKALDSSGKREAARDWVANTGSPAPRPPGSPAGNERGSNVAKDRPTRQKAAVARMNQLWPQHETDKTKLMPMDVEA